MAPNGEVEGPDEASGRTQVERSSPGVPDAAERAPRAHNLLQRPRRQTDHASRTPRTIVRSHPHRSPLCACGPSLATSGGIVSRLSAPLEASNEAKSRRARSGTGATADLPAPPGARPDLIEAAAARTRTRMRQTKTPARTSVSASSPTHGPAKRRRSLLFATLVSPK